ncbi:MAG: hypothetical protein KME51_17240 [Candidatus Thiodiazotropha sp. (ex Ctena orbiculata)]|uniref:Uncharacterized protein n=1 Tax=Candidatus Thiodiazotropha taylori TaxID=2792791 RepID=A0A944M9V8_9GAMM|nr:hypothetical protein [Candidatus Thiodiazotropha taylori]PUB84759.1 MAG: hypothetical protein DBP00_14300 [gamma proteobacterium symbiont of Ctena orbiculata]MBT2989999.1 hypothetical protein [Candidatus Thiodiazotropha taylori]MBT3002611.1 hypothetical protein [Candidatus Thiodiazotropha taylori]MBT3029300.1 hypothetical protein [Candidatus Thiodiazotropha taylori]
MKRRWFIPLPKWLFGGDAKPGQGRPNGSDEPDAKRRRFFTRAAVSAVSVTGTAGLAKAVVDNLPQPDLKQRYNKDAVNGEEELLSREYVLMTEREKQIMVQTLIENYDEKS